MDYTNSHDWTMFYLCYFLKDEWAGSLDQINSQDLWTKLIVKIKKDVSMITALYI